jgi:hypothetical protein
MCFIPSECFKATTSGFSHQQLVSEPRSLENRGVVGIHLIFQSSQKQVLIIPQCRVHPYELVGVKIRFIGARGGQHAPLESVSNSTISTLGINNLYIFTFLL